MASDFKMAKERFLRNSSRKKREKTGGSTLDSLVWGKSEKTKNSACVEGRNKYYVGSFAGV